MKNGKYVILYVEDDQDLLDAMKMVLEHHGYLMIGTRTAEEGLKAYKASKPDLIIVDLMMEEIDAGTNLVKEMKALGNKAPVYMLSSVGDNLSTITNYAELGLSGVFQKPLDNNKLIAILKSKLK